MGTITIGYSDSEDRAWVRLLEGSVEQRLWLTRRCVQALISSLAESLELSLANMGHLMMPIGQEGRLLLEQEEAAEEMAVNEAPPANFMPGVQVIDMGLCTIYDLKVKDQNWVITMHTACGNPLVFSGNRLQVHQVLKALCNRQFEANWCISLADWMKR